MPDNDQRSSEDPRLNEFLLLYASCQRSLFLYVVTLVPNPADAHDVLQETNLVLWTKFDQFEMGTNFFAWAREIARYQVLRYRQLYGAGRVIFSEAMIESLSFQMSHSEEPADEGRLGALAHCLEALRPEDRELIRQRYAAKCTVAVLAEKLERSENSVSQSLRRIRSALKLCIERTLLRENRSDR